MILCADLGNRSLTFSLYEEKKEMASFKTISDKLRSADEYSETLRQFLRLENLSIDSIEGAILSSVVPSLTKRVEKSINAVLGKTCMVLSRKLKTGLAIRMDNPSEVGSNLIAAGVGANSNYDEDCLVICLSACLSMTITTKDRQFLGGNLFPGIRESVSHMCDNNAQLMEIDLTRPGKLIAKSTKDSINSGVVRGYMLLIESMADEMEKEHGKPLKRILTGPDCGIIKDYMPHNFTVNSHLLMDGLYEIYQKNKETR
jgi:type III pantothenate kinase